MNISQKQKSRMEEHTISLALSLYRDEIHKIFANFKKITDNFSQEESIIHKRYFRAHFHPIVLASDFINRGYNKPLGYAGDFGMMNFLYRPEDAGENLFGKFFHRFCCEEPASVANKNRVEFLADELVQIYQNPIYAKNKNLSITSLACGPAKEIQLFLEAIDPSHGPTINLTLIDQEPEALACVQEFIRPLLSFKKNIEYTCLEEDAVLGIIKDRHFTTRMKNNNIIVCAGLFDYLSDRVAEKLIEKLYDLLAPGGVMYVGNVSRRNPDKFSMEYFMEWTLVLRNEDDLKQLVPDKIANLPGVLINVLSESLGLNLFLKIKKPL